MRLFRNPLLAAVLFLVNFGQNLEARLMDISFYRPTRNGELLDTVPVKKAGLDSLLVPTQFAKQAGLPRKAVSIEYLAWRPGKDSLGLFPLSCGKTILPLSTQGITSVGYMISNESEGFHLRFDNPYRIRTTNYLRKSKLAKIRTRSMGLELGYYSHPSLHRNLYLLGNKQWKYQRKKHWQYTVSLGAGYSRTFLTSPTYTLKDNEFRRVPLAGYNYLALQAGATLEYRFKDRATVYLGYNILGLAPYNWILLPRKQFQMGVSIPTYYFFDVKHRPK